ncbi:integrase [Ideonella dechloratans]|uniref:integrase n=1 Tax=Ideonella dechloratans TaxID=36863 RepID=UPI0035B1C211
MVTRSPALIQRLVQVAADAAAAGHGRKEAVYAAACAELGMSRPTLMRALSDVAVRGDRKRRVDAGQVSLTRDDAILISAMLMESLRKNGKRILSVAQAVDILRRNGEVKAEFLDPASGEVRPLSASAIARGLRTHGMHPDQLLRPAPAVEMQSLHPNHVWQIDASLCVLYYLKAGSDRESGLQVMRSSVFYKNKPANLKRIENDRVWRYVVTDHYSGAVWVHYVFGAESALNISESFIAAIQPSGDERRPVHGVPRIVMMDMGSANTSAVFLNLLKRLQVEPIAHAPENARATGQVEKAQDLVERSFESGLRFQPVATLDELNAQAAVWMTWFNGTQRHTRHGHTRYAMWATIRDEQLRLAPSVEMCRLLLTHQPESRKVNDRLRVEFGGQGREWDVSGIPRVMVGEKVMVTWNPYRDDEVYVVDADADGHEVLHSARLVERNAAGFAVTANVIGEDYKRPADTVADQHRKEVERAAMDAATLEEAEAKRKTKALPFGGRIDPHKGLEEQTASTAYIPRQGTALETTARISAAPERVLARFELARALVDLGVEMTPERNAQVAAWYPDGVPEGQLEDLKRRLTTRATLRVVGGGN